MDSTPHTNITTEVSLFPGINTFYLSLRCSFACIVQHLIRNYMTHKKKKIKYSWSKDKVVNITRARGDTDIGTKRGLI